MTKQSFTIPEGCKAVTVEQVGNQIITTFEPGFKRGDVLIAKSGAICIFDKISSNGVDFYEIIAIYRGKIYKRDSYIFGQTEDYRHATPEEAQFLWDALAKEGKRWNPETMQVETIKKKRWRAEKCKVYYCPIDFEGANSPTGDYKSIIDDYMFDNGFYCQTPDQSKRLFEVIKQVTDKFWEEELR